MSDNESELDQLIEFFHWLVGERKRQNLSHSVLEDGLLKAEEELAALRARLASAERRRREGVVSDEPNMLGMNMCRCGHPFNGHTYSDEKIGCDTESCKCHISMGD